MNVFISQPMNGLIKKTIKERYPANGTQSMRERSPYEQKRSST